MKDLPINVLLIDTYEDDYLAIQRLNAKLDIAQFNLEWVKTWDDVFQQIAHLQYDVYLIDGSLVKDLAFKALSDSVEQKGYPPIVVLVDPACLNPKTLFSQPAIVDFWIKDDLNLLMLERSLHYAKRWAEMQKELHQLRQEHYYLSLAIANVTTGIAITDPTLPDNPIIFVNPAFTQITGYTASEVVGNNCRFLQGTNTNADIVHDIKVAIDQCQPVVRTLVNYRKDGTPYWNELRINPVFDAKGHLTNFIGLQTDVTARRQAEEELRDSEERYALAAQGSNDGIWDWNLKTGEIYFSCRWKEMLGYEPEEIRPDQSEWFERIHPDDRSRVEREITAHLDGLTPHFENEHRMRHRDGQYRWMLSRGLAVRDHEGHVSRIAGSQSDITAHKQAEERLLHNALYDVLTDLPNRALLMDRLHHAIRVGTRNRNYRCALLFLDLDRFKVINDSLGHLMGDRLLIAIARRLSNCLRPCDTIARLGGDEFVILLEGVTDIVDVTTVADRILRELNQPFNLNGHEIFTSASIGIAFSSNEYLSAEDLIRDADTAMYRAKAQGRSCYQIFNTGMHTHAVTLLQLETDLRRAIERQELFLQYQPIVSLKTGRVVSFEALLRWRHPDRGLVSPAQFVPIAEETGLIIPLGLWVLQNACRQLQQWQQQYGLTVLPSISVNLSGKQLTPPLVNQIQAILEETEISPHHLRLEITESVLMDNTESAATLLAQLQNLGIQLSMDDFGTGYSSLSYLHRFPIDTLKIDRSFISKIDQNGEQLAIVRTIMTLAWNLGMEVVAEGVETGMQLSQLRSLRCEYGQGYLFSKPMDGEVAGTLIHKELIEPGSRHSAT